MAGSVGETDPINLSGRERESGQKKPGNETDRIDRMDMIRAYTEIIKDNIDYDSLLSSCGVSDREYVEEILDLFPRATSQADVLVCPFGD